MDIIGKLEIQFGNYEETNGSEIRFCCPKCSTRIGKEDTKYHLYVNVEDHVFYCHRCQWKGHLSQFVDSKDLKDPIKRKKKRKEAILDIEPDEYMALSSEPRSDLQNKAIRYLNSRHIFSTSELFFGVKDRWLGRILFPVYEDGKFVFATGRSVIGDTPKYLNTMGTKSHYIYRLDSMKNARSVVICEGCIDALSIQNGVAIFGKDLSDRQYHMLRRTIGVNTPIYIALDGDAVSDSVKLCERISNYWNKVIFLSIPSQEDVNSLHVKGKLNRVKQIPITPLNLMRIRCGEV